jgi:hypothetical protein
MGFERRLEDVERRLDPHPRVIAVTYRPEPVGDEDAPTVLTDEESELYHRLLAEALEANPLANGFTLYLSPERPRWETWE